MRLFCCVVAFAAFSASAAAQAQAPAQTARDSVARPNLTSVEITADSGRSGSVRLEVTPIVSSSPVQTIGDLLSGRVAGIDVLPAGATGQGPRVRLRGMASARFTNDPLMVVDGVRLSGSTATALADLPPEEVETIEVLKGPSATARHGTDGANGVIVVMTKRANVGGFRWNAFSENGIATDPNKGNYEDLWIAFDRTKRDATGAAPTCSLQAQAAGYCHIDSVFHHNVLNDPATTLLGTGLHGKFGAQVAGGLPFLRFFASGIQDRERAPYRMPAFEVDRLNGAGGTVPADLRNPIGLTRSSVRGTITTPFADVGDLTITAANSSQRRHGPDERALMAGASVSARTDFRATDGTPLGGYGFDESLAPIGKTLALPNSQQVRRTLGSADAHVTPLPWLTARAAFGVDDWMASARNTLWALGSDSLYSAGREDHRLTSFGASVEARRPIGPFHTRMSLGGERIDQRAAFDSATLTTPPGGRAESWYWSNYRQSAWFADVGVSYQERASLTSTLRRDRVLAHQIILGEAQFTDWYPSVSAAWLLSNEPFFRRPAWLDRLQLRAGFGESGTRLPGSEAVDSLLKTQRAREIEAGLEVGAFHEHTTVDLAYYTKRTDGAFRVLDPRNPIGFPVPLQAFGSAGAVRNRGVEATWHQVLVDGAHAGVDIAAVAAFNQNRILSIGGFLLPGLGPETNTPGYPLFGFWTPTYSFNDANGDGIIVPGELILRDSTSYRGPSMPTREIALFPRVELFGRAVTLTAQVDHKGGFLKYNAVDTERCWANDGPCRATYDPSAPLALQANMLAAHYGRPGFYSSAGMLYDGSFTRLRELSLAYRLPRSVAQRIRATDASLVAAGRNLAVWTRYPGVDPELSADDSDRSGNYAMPATPPLRSFTLRLNLAF
ncbi:MAG TPA: TonB-dependent receptor plug domain-containing protein [Vicinamibacterales bacterium]